MERRPNVLGKWHIFLIGYSLIVFLRLSVRTDPNAVMIEKSKKLDMSLKPGITLLSFGRFIVK